MLEDTGQRPSWRPTMTSSDLLSMRLSSSHQLLRRPLESSRFSRTAVTRFRNRIREER